jgi:hypothetical protein
VCAATGFTTTRISQGHVEAEQHSALQQALDEFHKQFGDIDAPDDVQLREIARRSRLADLRFDAKPIGDAGRTVKSLHDPRGRIVGWFSWAGDRAFIAAMDRLWGLLALVGAALAICTFIAMRAAKHVLRSLNHSAEDVRKLTTQDPLTGLANQRVMLERRGVGKTAVRRRGAGAGRPRRLPRGQRYAWTLRRRRAAQEHCGAPRGRLATRRDLRPFRRR